MTKPEEAEMAKSVACASCGSLDLAGWVIGKPLSFKRLRCHWGKEMYLCSSCFTMEVAGRQRDQAALRSMELFSRQESGLLLSSAPPCHGDRRRCWSHPWPVRQPPWWLHSSLSLPPAGL